MDLDLDPNFAKDPKFFIPAWLGKSTTLAVSRLLVEYISTQELKSIINLIIRDERIEDLIIT